MRNVVENALGPAGCGEDDVDGAANVGVESLEVVGGRAGGFDEAVELECEFVAGGKGGKANDLAEIADRGFGTFHVHGKMHGLRRAF